MEAVDRRVINSSAATAFLPAAEADSGRVLSGPGNTRNVFPFSAPPRTTEGVRYPSKPTRYGGAEEGREPDPWKKTHLPCKGGRRRPRSALPQLSLPRRALLQTLSKAFHKAGADLLCGEGGTWEGRGPRSFAAEG